MMPRLSTIAAPGSALLGAALALALGACSADPQDLLARAGREFAAHDFKAAQLDVATALKALPGNAAALELQGRTLLALGDGEGARAALGRLPAGARPADYALLLGEAALLRQKPAEAVSAVATDRSAEAFRIRAQAALLSGKEDDAGMLFTAGEGAPGPQARLLADHARLKLHQQDLAGARALAERATKADANSLDARLVGAAVAVASGDLAGGLSRYDDVVKGWPGNLAALVGKASVLGDLGRTKEMEQVLADAGKAGATSASLAWLQARAAAARGNWKAARELLQANEAALADRTEASLLYAQALIHLGQPEQARARLQPILTREPGNLAVRRALAEAALAARDPRGAVDLLRPLAARADAQTADLRLLAEAARQAGDADAERLAARARFPQPQEMARTLADADAAMKAGNWGNAIALYRRILAVTDGTNPLVLNNLAFAESQVGNKAEALDLALRALKAAPDNPSVMDTAAWLMLENGKDRARAVALLKAAAARAPANQTIRKHLADAG